MKLVHALPLATFSVFIERYEQETDWRKGKFLSKKRGDFIFHHLEQYRNTWRDLGWTDFAFRLDELLHLLKWGNDGKYGTDCKRLSAKELTPMVHKAFEELRQALDLTMDEYQFVMVDKQKRAFLEQDDLFGKSVSIVFPSAKQEIKDAGICIALELNTAAVFHLMRGIEFGLRALALHLKIKKIKKNVPIEYATWDEIIVAMEKQTEVLGLKTRGAKRQSSLDFYNELLKEARSIKDLWRNPVSHARRTFSTKDVEAIFDHVRNFMQKLATRVSETKR